MRIYFSGGQGLKCTPEALVPQRRPHIMLTFHDIKSNGTLDRLKVYTRRVEQGGEFAPGLYTESLFMDSGAYTLVNDYVFKRRDKVLRQSKDERFHAEGNTLLPPKIFRGRGDYSHFDLSPGTPFRFYCDRFAKFIQRFAPSGVLTTNVDAIMNPKKTWEIQQYFQEEHGVRPIPVVHGLTPLKWLDKYLEDGHELIGLGGLGHAVRLEDYIKWGDAVFDTICPRPKRLPQIRIHGFAMTSWSLMQRWPWWSVDSATWVKLSAYGWLYVPRWSKSRGWLFDSPPMQINVSYGKHPEQQDEAAYLTDLGADNYSPLGKKRDKHLDNVQPAARDAVLRWVERCNLQLGSVDGNGQEKVFGVRSHFRARSIANLHYLKDLEESRPAWPHRLDNESVNLGFGL